MPQYVHDRTLDLGEMQHDIAFRELPVDRLQCLQCTEVDFIHRRAHEDHVANFGALVEKCIYARLDKTGIGEIQALVDAQ